MSLNNAFEVFHLKLSPSDFFYLFIFILFFFVILNVGPPPSEGEYFIFYPPNWFWYTNHQSARYWKVFFAEKIELKNSHVGPIKV